MHMTFSFAISLGMLACTLDRTVALAPYGHAGTATVEEWRDSRAAVEKFMDCSPAAIGVEARKTFFDVVTNEFTTEHHNEAGDDAIGIFQTDLRRFMEKLVDRSDASSKDVILR